MKHEFTFFLIKIAFSLFSVGFAILLSYYLNQIFNNNNRR